MIMVRGAEQWLSGGLFSLTLAFDLILIFLQKGVGLVQGYVSACVSAGEGAWIDGKKQVKQS